jgi:hypothetical protein
MINLLAVRWSFSFVDFFPSPPPPFMLLVHIRWSIIAFDGR